MLGISLRNFVRKTVLNKSFDPFIGDLNSIKHESGFSVSSRPTHKSSECEDTTVDQIDCWISADETAGKRLLTKLKVEKPRTNVRSLFFLSCISGPFFKLVWENDKTLKTKNKNRD